jgi:hypothetical protein
MRKLYMLPVLLGLMLVYSSNDASADGKKGSDANANDGVITNWGKPSGL